jgi:hypothetical protein
MEQHEIDGIKNLLLSDYEPNVQVGFTLLKQTFSFTQKQVNIFIIDNVLPVVFDMFCLVLHKHCKKKFSEHLTKLDSEKEIIYCEYLYNCKKEGMYRVLFRGAKTKEIHETDYFRFFLRQFIANIEISEINYRNNSIEVKRILSPLKIILEYLHKL